MFDFLSALRQASVGTETESYEAICVLKCQKLNFCVEQALTSYSICDISQSNRTEDQKQHRDL